MTQPIKAWVAPSARDFTRDYMMAQLAARGYDPIPWYSGIPAQRPAKFFTIEELNTTDEYGVIAEAQLIQIRGYITDRKRLGEAMRLIKALWKVMPAADQPDGTGAHWVQDVEHAGGVSYDEDPDVPGLYYGQVIAWVTVMTELM